MNHHSEMTADHASQEAPSSFEALAAADRNAPYYSATGERVLHAIFTMNGEAADEIRRLIVFHHDVTNSSVRHIINSRVRSIFSPEQQALAEAAIWRECGDDSRLNAISPPRTEGV